MPCRVGTVRQEEALDRLEKRNIGLNYCRVKAFPFTDAVREFIDQHEVVYVVEQNRDAQLRTLLIDDIDAVPCQLVAERDRLKQVVNNLITNAVEAVSGCRQPCIRIESRASRPGRWEVAIIDNGPGISADVAERAFESFVTTKDAGTGLGLAIVKRIVDLHGGRAKLRPEPEGGTRASFWIPTEA